MRPACGPCFTVGEAEAQRGEALPHTSQLAGAELGPAAGLWCLPSTPLTTLQGIYSTGFSQGHSHVGHGPTSTREPERSCGTGASHVQRQQQRELVL